MAARLHLRVIRVDLLYSRGPRRDQERAASSSDAALRPRRICVDVPRLVELVAPCWRYSVRPVPDDVTIDLPTERTGQGAAMLVVPAPAGVLREIRVLYDRAEVESAGQRRPVTPLLTARGRIEPVGVMRLLLAGSAPVGPNRLGRSYLAWQVVGGNERCYRLLLDRHTLDTSGPEPRLAGRFPTEAASPSQRTILVNFRSGTDDAAIQAMCKRLEQELGVRWFRCSTTSVTVTDDLLMAELHVVLDSEPIVQSFIWPTLGSYL